MPIRVAQRIAPGLLACAGLAAGEAAPLGGGGYGGWTERAAEGPHLRVVCATHFGGAGHEEFLGGGQLADGAIAAIGNAWGPQFPDRAPVQVIGAGRHGGASATVTDAKPGKASPDPKSPDMAGMVVLYAASSAGLKATRALRFDWGVASISAGVVAGDGMGLIVAGRCLGGFASVLAKAKVKTSVPWAAPAEGKAPPQGEDVYVARLAPDGAVAWVVVLEKNGDAPDRVFSDEKGQVYVDARGLQRIAADGSACRLLVPRTGTGTARWLGVDPRDGSSFYGGDRNTHTGKEPYRQPYCYKFDAEGRQVQKLWEPVPKAIGSGPGGVHLESDSSIRTMAIGKDGALLFSGWSDGGNSVLPRQPLGHEKGGIAGKGLGMSTAGMNAGSVTHLMRVDAKTFEGLQHSIWMGVVPQFFDAPKSRGKPNGTDVHAMAVLAGGELAFTGSAATGLIQTPNAFWKDPMLPDKHGGPNVTVLRKDLSGIVFSSYTPGVDGLVPVATKDGLVVFGRSTGSDGWVKPTDAPSINADQPFAGGHDGHAILLKLP